MKFYSNFFSRGNNLYVRGYTDKGIQVQNTYDITPVLYTEKPPKSFSGASSEHTNIYGNVVYPTKFSSPKEAREFLKSYSDSGMRIWGYPRFDYAKIDELFPGVVNFDLSLIRIMAIDCETTVSHGFPDIFHPKEEVTLISASFKGKVYTFGARPYVNTDPDVVYVECKDEEHLFKKFIEFYVTINPDVVTGWNINGFDLPYLYNRITNIINEEYANKLSPYGWCKKSTTNFNGRDGLVIEISGIMVIDYLELYKKFELSPRENYRLDTIAQIELDERKVEYDCTFKELYTDHWQEKFVPYNVQDVRLIDRLDKKLGFIAIAASMAYRSKCNYVDVYRVTRVWDNIIANFLRESNIHVIADFRHHGDTYEGAFVKPTIPGLFKIVASFDVKSLYPSLICQYNISPDTILPPKYFPNINATDVIERNGKYELAVSLAKEHNATLCANGSMYRKDKRGFMPTLVELYMKERESAKKEMKKWQKEAEAAKLQLIKLEEKETA